MGNVFGKAGNRVPLPVLQNGISRQVDPLLPALPGADAKLQELAQMISYQFLVNCFQEGYIFGVYRGQQPGQLFIEVPFFPSPNLLKGRAYKPETSCEQGIVEEDREGTLGNLPQDINVGKNERGAHTGKKGLSQNANVNQSEPEVFPQGRKSFLKVIELTQDRVKVRI